MLSVPGAKTVRGFSQFGDSYVYVIFEDGTDPYWARSRVLEYLNHLELMIKIHPNSTPPSQLQQPSVEQTQFQQSIQQVGLSADTQQQLLLWSLEDVLRSDVCQTFNQLLTCKTS